MELALVLSGTFDYFAPAIEKSLSKQSLCIKSTFTYPPKRKKKLLKWKTKMHMILVTHQNQIQTKIKMFIQILGVSGSVLGLELGWKQTNCLYQIRAYIECTLWSDHARMKTEMLLVSFMFWKRTTHRLFVLIYLFCLGSLSCIYISRLSETFQLESVNFFGTIITILLLVRTILVENGRNRFISQNLLNLKSCGML